VRLETIDPMTLKAAIGTGQRPCVVRSQTKRVLLAGLKAKISICCQSGRPIGRQAKYVCLPKD